MAKNSKAPSARSGPANDTEYGSYPSPRPGPVDDADWGRVNELKSYMPDKSGKTPKSDSDDGDGSTPRFARGGLVTKRSKSYAKGKR